MEHSENHIVLRGSLMELPHYSHENHGTRFLAFTMEVPRLSGTLDLLPVIVPEPRLEPLDPSAGSMIRVEGQIRSHNIQKEDGRHLQIFVFGSQIAIEDGDPINDVVLAGSLCRDPVLRRTPLGRDICDVMLAVPRAYHRADYLPCILWGTTAQEVSLCRCRDSLEICGRLQSRTYNKVIGENQYTRIAYEISAMTARTDRD